MDKKKYKMEYYSAIKTMPFTATWMGLEIVIPSEVSQRKINFVWYGLYVESKKSDTYELKDRLTDTEHELMITKGEKGIN